MRLCDKTIHELSDMLDKKEISSTALAADVIARIGEVNERFGGYITVLDEEKILAQAAQSDERLAAGGRKSKLDGIPYALKDNMCTDGIATTCASKMLENFYPPYNAAVYDYMRSSGAVLIGKSDMDEFAMGSLNENSALSYSKNPWNEKKVSGGSSGGSAVVTASGQAVFALGSDTGGSIRLPSSFCGLTGFKPTYSAVSRYGVVAFASSLDQVGPLTKDIMDSAIVLDEIVRHDERDSTSVAIERKSYFESLNKDMKGMKIGIDKVHYDGLDQEIKESVLKAADIYVSLGAELVDISIDMNDYALAAYYIIGSAEASSNLARYDGVKYGLKVKGEDLIDAYTKTRSAGFGAEVKRRIMLGTFVLSSGYYDAYYKKALRARTMIKENYDKAFESCDFILSPTAISGAFDIGQKTEDPTQLYLADLYTVTANIAGLPAVSLPCGMTSERMPIGLQLTGRAYAEQTLLNAGYAFQSVTDYHLARAIDREVQ